MRRLYNVNPRDFIELNTYILVKHENNNKKFLFEIPNGLEVIYGDDVLCDTIKGETRGSAVSYPFDLDDNALHQLRDLLGFYWPVKKIIAKLEMPKKEIDEDLPF
ncbi:MAG TPA: hypothetical protein GXZ70_09145 [Clostridiales bacterium]|nr:hypothetical protein [Clostridiales bacterium]